MNFVFTVCDNAAEEVCPIWPGQPMTAHWGVPDPAAVAGTPEQIERAFRDAFMILERRISLLLCLPLASLDKLAIQKEIDRIGKTSEAQSAQACSRRVFGHLAPRGDRSRLRRHGRTPCGRKRRAGSTCQYHSNRSHTRCSDPHVWTDLRRTLQSCSLRGRCTGTRSALGGCSGVYPRSTLWWHWWNDTGPRDVLTTIRVSVPTRSEWAAQFVSEFTATFGLLSVIWGCSRSRSTVVPFAVGSYITAAYWFTASTSFANPAVTIARALSDTFAGIRPMDVPLFITAQFVGGIAATLLFRWLVPSLPSTAKDVLVTYRKAE